MSGVACEFVPIVGVSLQICIQNGASEDGLIVVDSVCNWIQKRSNRGPANCRRFNENWIQRRGIRGRVNSRSFIADLDSKA